MSKNLSVKRTLFTGTLLLTAAGILSRFIGFFYKIFLSRTIGAEGLARRRRRAHQGSRAW